MRKGTLGLEVPGQVPNSSKCMAQLPRHLGTRGPLIPSPNSWALIPRPNFLEFGQRISENPTPLNNAPRGEPHTPPLLFFFPFFLSTPKPKRK